MYNYSIAYSNGFAGGRVGIHCRRRYTYGGILRNRGGFGDKATSNSTGIPLHGAAGTIYIEETLREMRYRKKKYDKVRNESLLTADHIHLLVNNEGLDIFKKYHIGSKHLL